MSARSKVTKAVLSRIFKKELLKHCGGFTAPGLFEQSRTQPAMLSHLSSCLVWQAGIATRHESTSARTSSGATSELVSQAAPRTYLVHSGNYILSREPGISGHTVPSLHEAARYSICKSLLRSQTLCLLFWCETDTFILTNVCPSGYATL